MILSISGRKPPDDIIDNDKLNASNVLRFTILNKIKINIVNEE